MSSNKCQFMLCGKSREKFPGLKMYRFPKDERKDLWLMNSGNEKLFYYDEKKLHNQMICQEHFSPESFTNGSMKRLSRFAIPYKYNKSFEQSSPSKGSHVNRTNGYSDKELSPSTTVASSSINSHSILGPSSPIVPEDKELSPSTTVASSSFNSHSILGPSSPIVPEDIVVCDLIEMTNVNRAPRKRKLKNRIQCQQIILCNIALLNSKYTKNVEKIKARKTLKYLLKYTTKTSKAIVTTQFKNNLHSWTLAEKNLALSMFHNSPSTYEFLRLKNMTLPDTSIIHRWIRQLNILPGHNEMYFDLLRNKFDSKPYTEKVCSICVVQISIEQLLEYSKIHDFIEGFEDLGAIGGRTCKTAFTALVLMARGIYSSWEIPISYFLLSYKSSNCVILKKSLIMSTLQTIVDIGMKPRIIVCNQNPNEPSHLQALGTTEEEPYFYMGGEKIFVIYDTPHLLNSLWNDLKGATFTNGDDIISYIDIINTYLITNRTSTPSTILDANLGPNSNQKLQLNSAAQVFSRSMFLAMQTCIVTEKLESETAQNTANFVKFMNTLCNCLSSKNIFSDNPYNCALSDTSVVKTCLPIALNYFRNLIKCKNGQITRPLCFRGFIHTINGVLQLFEYEKKYGLMFLLTNRLNQDCFNSLFSILRQKAGCDRNPSARIIRTSFKSLCISSLCTSETSNNFDINQEKTEDINTTNTNEVDRIADFTFMPSLTSNCSTAIEIETPYILGDCSLTYFAGYLAYRCIDKFKCKYCKKILISSTNLNDESQLRLLNKLYAANIKKKTILMASSTHFYLVIDHAISVLEDEFEKNLHQKNIKANLMNILKKDSVISSWLANFKKKCVKHCVFILEKLLMCQILEVPNNFHQKN